MSVTKQITTKNGYKTHIDRYSVYRGGKCMLTVWGKTKAKSTAWNYARTLFNPHSERIEIVNQFTGEITKL